MLLLSLLLCCRLLQLGSQLLCAGTCLQQQQSSFELPV